MKLYIAGPMTGYPDHNFPAFNAMAKNLRELGFEVVNPAELVEDTTQPWEFYMRRDIPLLCQCDGIVLLPGWQHSRGAQLEQYIARALKMGAVQWNGLGFSLASTEGTGLLTAIRDAQVLPEIRNVPKPSRKAQRAAEPLANLLFPGKGKPVFAGDAK